MMHKIYFQQGAYIYMKTFAKCLLIFIVYAFLIQEAHAKIHCFKDTICVETVRNDRFIDVYVKNQKTFDVTITLTMKAENMRLPEQSPYTETVSGNSTVRMLHIPIIDGNARCSFNYHVNWTRGSKYAEHDDSYVYRLPYAAGSFYRIAQSSHELSSHGESSLHAVDIGMPEGTPVYSAREGRVVGMRSFNDIGGPIQDFADYSNYVIIRHEDGTLGEYHHLQKNGAAVSIGETVQKGQLIGYSGNTGYSSSPHLHFGVYKSYDGHKRTSLPVKFSSTEGIISSLFKGDMYIAD